MVTNSILIGVHRNERVGAYTDCRRFWGRFRGEETDKQEINEVNNNLVASVGTASTIGCIGEALGIVLTDGAIPPAVTSDCTRIAEESGRRAIIMARNGLSPDKTLTEKPFENALRVLLSMGGSTNGILHLTVFTGRTLGEDELGGELRMARTRSL
ncbi:dihydroxy-acid dehydratase domain-containing protein [Pseudomonas monteilii]|uniref:dihydroxy-acid dehydratase domain-containing protein n=1 Tax=Pseudomonas monteilii TaxID=76759 RepID=UPI001C70CF2F|nr:dihydroxy-acid dehydratase [Pseudomonas monteilii]